MSINKRERAGFDMSGLPEKNYQQPINEREQTEFDLKKIPDHNFWAQLNNSVLIRFLLLFACGWALIQVLDYFQVVIFIFTFATVIAFLLSYPVRWLYRFFPHTVAVCLVFLVSIIIVVGITLTVGLTILSQAQQLIDNITIFLKSVTPVVTQLEAFLNAHNIRVNLVAIEDSLRNQALTGIVSGLAFLQAFFTNFLYFIFIAVIAFFMLLDGEKLWQLMLKFIPSNLRSRFSSVTRRKFLGFFKGQFLLGLFHFGISFLVFLILKVPFALLLAFIGGLLNLIPGIGATLAVIIIFLLVLSQNVWLALKVVIFSLIIQQVQDNLISPRIMRNSLNLNPVVVFFALLIGARVAGLLGIFIAIPVTGVIVTFFGIDEMKGDV